MSDKEQAEKLKRQVALVQELGQKVKELLNGWIRLHENKQDMTNMEAMLIIYQVMAFHLGYVDRVTHRLGTTAEIRSKIVDQFILMGHNAADRAADAAKSEPGIPPPPKDGYLS